MESLTAFLLHHWDLALATGIVATLIIILEIHERAHGVPQVNTHDAVNLINRENALVIDVRAEKAFLEGHILKALNIPLHTLEARTFELEKNKEKSVILVCVAGNQSVQAAKQLHRKGFNKVYSLKGGMGAWRLASLPIVK